MKTLLFLLGNLFILTVQAQSLQSSCNQFRSGDRLMKRVITTYEPGPSGSGQIWDFSDLELKDAGYELKYVSQGIDTIVGIEHHTMYYYRTSGDSLFCLGYENPSTFISYQKPELLMAFPVFQGRVMTDYFDGKGNYCERMEVRLRGKSTVTADASCVLILSEVDTLRKVIRTYTHKFIHQRMIPRIAMQDSLQLDTIPFVLNRDSIEYLLASDSIRQETETLRWYADGYRYPVMETVKSIVYKFGVPYEHFTTSFVYLPDEQYYDLPYDTDNQERRDLSADEEHERNWKNTDESGQNKRNNSMISYNFHIGKDGSLYINYELKQPGEVILMFYDMQGRQLAGIQRADQTIGNYKEVISMNSYPRGEYLLRITVGENQYGEKIIKY